MQIDPNWVSAVVATAVASGGVATWIERKRAERRAALPVVTNSGGNISIINRLDEALDLIRVDATGPVTTQFGAYGDDGNFDPELTQWMSVPAQITMRIMPRATANFTLWVKQGHASPTVWLVFNSSAGTLRNRRVRVEMFLTIHLPDSRSRLARMLSRARSIIRRRSARRQ